MWREHSFGFPQEDQHSANVVQGLEEPLETGEDGKATLCGRPRPPIIFGAYESAATGRKAALPFTLPRIAQELMRKRPLGLCVR